MKREVKLCKYPTFFAGLSGLGVPFGDKAVNGGNKFGGEDLCMIHSEGVMKGVREDFGRWPNRAENKI